MISIRRNDDENRIGTISTLVSTLRPSGAGAPHKMT
jgi:hypothetical protein